jgi:hypothetical protein
MGEGELELCLPSPIFGRGAGGEGKDLSKIGMLPGRHWINCKTKAILPIIRGVVKKLGDGTGKFNLRNSDLTYHSFYLTVE